MQKNYSYLPLFAVIAFLFGCTSVPVAVDGQSDATAATVEAVPDETVVDDEPAEEEPVPPNKDLDGDLLYDLLLTDIAMYGGDRETAVKSAVMAAEAAGDFRVARKATTLAMRTRLYDDAVKAATIWSELQPEQDEAEYAIVIALLASGKVEEAMPRIYGLVDSNEESVEAGVRVVTALLGQQPNPDPSFEVISHLTEKYPDNAQVYLGSAYIAQLHGKMAMALAAVDEALALRPGWESAAMLKFDQLESAGREDDLKAFVVKFLDENPQNPALRTKYARLLVREDRADEAWDEVSTALKSDKDSAEALYFAGVLGLQLENFEEAEELLGRLVEVDEDNDAARMYLAALADDDERTADAIRWYGEVEDPRLMLDANLQIAQIITRTEGVDAGLDHLDQIEYQSEGEYVKYVLTRHDILTEDQRLQQAFDYLNEALHDLPGNTDLLYARGLIAAELNHLDVVETDLRFLLDRDPSNAHALNALGYTLADRTDRYDEAMGLIERALELRPDDPYIIDSMGWVHYRLGNTDESLRHLRNAYMVREDVEIAAHLGEVLWNAGQLDEANSIWDQALESQPDNPILVETIERLRP
jgi:tetratricopeptide (TPR) repeat protein